MTTRIVPLLASLLLLAGATATAQMPTPEATPEAMPTPDETLESTDPTVGAPPNVHGFITVRYMVDDGKGSKAFASENGYDVQYMRINIDGKAHEFVKYFVAMELGDIKTGAATSFKEAYVVWAPKPKSAWLRKLLPEFKAGRMRRPGGLESFVDENELLTTDRSVVSGFMQNDDPEAPAQDYRDYGIRAGGVAGPIEAAAVGMTNGTKGPQTTSQPQTDEEGSKDVSGRLGFKFGHEGGPFFIRAGASSGGGKDTSNHVYTDAVLDVEYWNTAADLTLSVGPLQVQTEGVYGKRTLRQPNSGPVVDTATGSAAYLLVSYRFRGRTAPYFRFAYRELSMNDEDKDLQVPRDWGNEITAGVNVQLVKKTLTARAQYTLRSGFTTPHPAVGPAGAYNGGFHGVASASIQADF